MALSTAQDYLIQALRKCGQMRPGYMPAPELLADGLNEWFLLFDNFNAERTLNFTMPDYVFPVTGPGHGSTGNGQTFGGSGFEIGPTAADFVAPRPTAIARANLYMTSVAPNSARLPLAPVSMEEWMGIAVPALSPAINVTNVFAYDPQFPNGVIWVWPPLNGNSLEIFTWGQLTPPAGLGTAYAAPPGYADAVTWSLAERLWPMVTKDMAIHKVSLQYLAGKARAGQAKLRAINAPMPRLSGDFQSGSPRVGESDWNLLFTGN